MKNLTTAFGAPVDGNQSIKTSGEGGPALLENVWFIEELAHFDREVIPERRMHAKGAGAFGNFSVTHDITRYTKAKTWLTAKGVAKALEDFVYGTSDPILVSAVSQLSTGASAL